MNESKVEAACTTLIDWLLKDAISLTADGRQALDLINRIRTEAQGE